MTDAEARECLARFRRQMRAAAAMRWVFLVAMTAGLASFYFVGDAAQTWVLGAMALLAGTWIALGVRGARLAREARLGAMLLEAGEIDAAQQHFLTALTGLTPLRSVKLLACHQLAVTAHVSRAHRGAAVLCRGLLAHRLGSMKSVATATRLILADSLLTLDDVVAAGDVVKTLSRTNLSLADQMTFLPIELRYQLSAGKSADAVESLPDKVRLAELLDSPAASLSHALLAEACRRNDLATEKRYLLRRAALLGDIDALLEKHRPLLGQLGAPPTSIDTPDPMDD